ncbi:MAG: hypothetical protein LLF97_05825 [Planctomycetaceae bacterium]|nr:hypothetical protein [Planctomycetaceae bacterium]
MLLYHGTTATILNNILQEGIKPRGDRPSLWPDLPSRPDCAYMTDGYGFYFAVAVQEYDKKVVFEIDTDRLNQRLLLPDEDFVVQLAMNVLGSQRWAEFTTDAKKDFGREIKENLEKYVVTYGELDGEKAPGLLMNDDGSPRQFDEAEMATVIEETGMSSWEASVKVVATCAYKGTIPPSAITRYCVFDQQKRILLAALSYNRAPGLSPDCLQRNEHARNLTKWFFGDRKKLPRYIPSNLISSLNNPELAAYLRNPNWVKESAWRMGVDVVSVATR